MYLLLTYLKCSSSTEQGTIHVPLSQLNYGKELYLLNRLVIARRETCQMYKSSYGILHPTKLHIHLPIHQINDAFITNYETQTKLSLPTEHLCRRIL